MRRSFLGLAVAAFTALGVVAPSSAALGQAKQVTQGHISGTGAPASPGASITSVSGFLSGVSAVSASNIWAVGAHSTSLAMYYGTLVLHWNGTAWTRVASPSPGPEFSFLSGVSAVSASNIWAVGAHDTSSGAQRTLVLHWNGTAWARVASPSPGGLSGYSSLSDVRALSASNIWAVGNYSTTVGINRTLVLHWNGTAWTKVASPNPGGLNGSSILSGVSAVSASNIWAVGGYSTSSGGGGPLVLHWNGTAWTKVASPTPGFLHAVSVVSASNVWAVGSYRTSSGADRTLVLHWNGTAWTKVASPNPGGLNGYSYLSGVRALSASNAWAVGGYATNPDGVPSSTLVLHWNGTAWAKVASPSPGGFANGLSGMSAVSASNIWAVGRSRVTDEPETESTLLLHWNGTRWTRF